MELSDREKKIVDFVIIVSMDFGFGDMFYFTYLLFIYQQTWKMSIKIPLKQIKKQVEMCLSK